MNAAFVRKAKYLPLTRYLSVRGNAHLVHVKEGVRVRASIVPYVKSARLHAVCALPAPGLLVDL